MQPFKTIVFRCEPQVCTGEKQSVERGRCEHQPSNNRKRAEESGTERPVGQTGLPGLQQRGQQ